MNHSGSPLDDVTIVIPTMNRSLFVIRALHYYAKEQFSGWICIGDSSEEEEFQKTNREVELLSCQLNVMHRRYPSTEYPNEATVVKALIEIVPTCYVCQYGDDDFLVTSGMEKCAVFLNNNLDYQAACGKYRIEFSLRDDEVYFGQIESVIKVEENDLDRANASDRFVTYMRNALAPTYNLFRRETFQSMYEETDVAITRYFGPELLVCGVAALAGKTKTLDALTLMFQVHDQHIFSWYDQSIYETMVDVSFSISINILRNRFVGLLVFHDQLERLQAREIVDRELWAHIYQMLGWQYKDRYRLNNGKKGKLIQRIKNTRGIGRPFPFSLSGIYWGLRKAVFRSPKYWIRAVESVKAMSSTNYRFQEEFTNIYEYLLNPPPEVLKNRENYLEN